MGNEASQQSKGGAEIPNDMVVSWKKHDSDLPARDGHSCCCVENKMYVFGGVMALPNGDFKESNDLLQFNPETQELSIVHQKGDIPAPRSSASVAAVGKNIYLFGGISQETGWYSLDEVHVFNTESLTWSIVKSTGTPPSPRDKHATTPINNKIYLFGGFGPKFEEEEVEEVDEFSEDDDEVTGLEAQQEAAQFGWFNDLFVFDTETNAWSNPLQMNLGVPTPRAAFGLYSVNKHLVIFGGKDSVARQNDIHIFDTETRRWLTDMKSSGKAPEPRSFHTVTTIDTRVVVFGGRGLRNQHFGDVHVFDTTTQQWLQPKVEGSLPPARGVHSAAVVDDQLVIYGGSADFHPELMQCTKYFGDIFTMKTSEILSGSANSEPQKSPEKRKLDPDSPGASGSSEQPKKSRGDEGKALPVEAEENQENVAAAANVAPSPASLKPRETENTAQMES